MIIRIKKQFPDGDVVTDEISQKAWDMITVDEATGARNGWREIEATAKPKPPKEVTKLIEKRVKVEEKEEVKKEPKEDVDKMKRNELMTWLKQREIKFSAKNTNKELKEIIKDVLSKE